MKMIFQKFLRLLGKDPHAEKVNPSERYRGSATPRRRRSYVEGEAHHDRWVELLSPHAVICAARDLSPWRQGAPKRPRTAVEMWRLERHAALMRRIRRERLGDSE